MRTIAALLLVLVLLMVPTLHASCADTVDLATGEVVPCADQHTTDTFRDFYLWVVNSVGGWPWFEFTIINW